MVPGAIAVVAFVIGLFLFAASHITAVVAVAGMLGQQAYAAEHPEARVKTPTA